MRGRRQISVVVAIYVLVGVLLAYDRNYLTARLLRSVVSAVLAVLLWFLLLLGVDLNVG